MNMTEQL